LALPAQYVEVADLLCHCIDQAGRPIGASVIDHQDAGLWQRSSDPPNDPLDILSFVVGRDDDQDTHGGSLRKSDGSPGSSPTCSRGCRPTRCPGPADLEDHDLERPTDGYAYECPDKRAQARSQPVTERRPDKDGQEHPQRVQAHGFWT